MNKLIKLITLINMLSIQISCDISLSIQMDYFLNPNGIKANKQLCFDHANKKCATYFRFCVLTSGNECTNEFSTQIIGENSINTEQFKMTTDSIEFPIQVNNDNNVELIVKIYNDEQRDDDDSSLISKWKVENLIEKTKGQWFNFNQINKNLNQQISFNYKMECTAGFQGKHCEKPICSSGCDLNKGGFCEKPNQCLCKKGWTGSKCDKLEIVEETCDLPCKNGGQCVIENKVKKCKCNSNGFKGNLCQIRVTQQSCESSSLPCLNGGSCMPNGECLCPPGYAGDRCQTKRLTSQCGLVTCYNGGTCFIDNQNEYACICHPAFTGSFCENKIQTTTATKKTTTTTTLATTTTATSTSTAVLIEEIILSTPTSTNEKFNSHFTGQEITLIVLLGIGMPTFVILVAVVLCRYRVIKNTSDTIDKAKSIEEPINTKKQNIYVSNNELKQQGNKNDLNLIKNNLFEKSCDKQISIQTISSKLSCHHENETPKQVAIINAHSNMNLVDNNIYSIYNYQSSNNLNGLVNCKSYLNNHMAVNQKKTNDQVISTICFSNNNIMASIV